jgi:hypothetical protein
VAREQYPFADAIRAIAEECAAIVLFESMLPGYIAMPHVAVDLDHAASRKVARALGASYVTPHFVTPPPAVSAPTATWLDGEAERIERKVVDRAVRAMRSLLAALGLSDEKSPPPPVRVVLKAIAEVSAPLPGLVEPVVAPGALVRLGEVAAYSGAPGLASRRPLRAPATGVVLWTRSGQLSGGAVVGIGKLRRALPAVMRAHKTNDARASIDLGWCERVALPSLGIDKLKAKIDTGARTCALHVASMRDLGDGRWEIEAPGRKSRKLIVEVHEFAQVRDSRGRVERRPVIETALRLGPVERRVRISLTHRGDMLFPMLIGRTALGPEFRVHPARRFLLR